MPKKDFTLAGGLTVTVYKRKASRHLRLTIGHKGEIKVSIPRWAPYRAGVEFAQSREAWILTQQKPPNLLAHGQAIGKAHHLRFKADPSAKKVSGRVKQSLVVVSHPPHLEARSPDVQTKAEQACIRALRQQARQLLPQRLASLAAAYGFDYGNVSIKTMKSRWGSCDQNKNIALNLYLMQLPWELIDYVLLHELTHTTVHKHGPDFWKAMRANLPQVRQLRRAIREHQPVLAGSMV